jgi:hypothetical protein
MGGDGEGDDGDEVKSEEGLSEDGGSVDSDEARQLVLDAEFLHVDVDEGEEDSYSSDEESTSPGPKLKAITGRKAVVTEWKKKQPLIMYEATWDDGTTSWEYMHSLGDDGASVIAAYWAGKNKPVPHPMPVRDTIVGFKDDGNNPHYAINTADEWHPLVNMAHMQEEIDLYWTQRGEDCPHPIGGGSREVDEAYNSYYEMLERQWDPRGKEARFNEVLKKNNDTYDTGTYDEYLRANGDPFENKEEVPHMDEIFGSYDPGTNQVVEPKYSKEEVVQKKWYTEAAYERNMLRWADLHETYKQQHREEVAAEVRKAAAAEVRKAAAAEKKRGKK